MKNSVLSVVFVLGLALILVRCARETIIEVPDEPSRIVMISHFTEGQPVRVKVTLSQPVYSGREPQTPAVVDISLSSRGVFLDKLKRSDPGQPISWYSRDTIQPNTPYTLVARIAGMPVAEATDEVPVHGRLKPVRIIDSLIRTEDLGNGNMALRVPLELELFDPRGSNLYFAFSLMHELDVYDVSEEPPFLDYTSFKPSFFLADGPTLALLHDIPEPIVLINRNFWNDGRRTINLTAYIPYNAENEVPRSIFVEWRTLSESFYRYHLSVARQGNNNTPLADPDAVFNNVKNGYGNVSAYSVSVDTLMLPN